ncbi:MAG: CrcB family protein [Corynebacterium sp.]|uniref:fluoride efflux transporter FluC n=1 Tax=Corynebacterium sp. TaxID=1720 RepID=UPI0026DC2073|nr:CrcB family protein [Corynebacterium sp.]MDO5030756.1 CrcB family protein [Corynebacterium sp.]
MTHLLLGTSLSTALLAIASVALGAALGGALRYTLAELAVAWRESKLPGTWTANMAACLAAGVAVTAWSQVPSSSENVRPALAYAAVMIGFAGGLSTWSTLAGELVRLRSQHIWRGLSYLILTVVGGEIFAYMGMSLPPLVTN